MILFYRVPILFLVISCAFSSCAQKISFSENCEYQSHETWTQLVQEHVDSTGWISYQGFVQDSVRLNAYLAQLSKCGPSESWTDNQKLCYWINAYNAFTVKLIVDHYPVASIKNIKRGIPFVNSVWEMNFFEIEGQKMNLSLIEHKILRKEFNEPRMHFAIVCASKSCPRLLNMAYEPEKLEEQLSIQTRNFVNDNSKNEIEVEEIRISSIFKWFKNDFIQKGTIQEFIIPYSNRDFDSSAKVKYLDYDWSLNGE